ncbi:MAG: hypothetical protein M5R36_22795 [Deltaproteobacteria bacterium]|nr:hypothetical protein [Deltaproteobacteria bacterium]
MRGLLGLLLVLSLTACAVPLDQINGARRTVPVTLSVEPSDAKVFLDGTYIGKADRFDGDPGTLDLTAGGHVLRFESDEFENERRELVAGDKPLRLDVKMLPKPRAAP